MLGPLSIAMDSSTPKRLAFQPEPYRDFAFVEFGPGAARLMLVAGALGAAAVYVWWRRRSARQPQA